MSVILLAVGTPAPNFAMESVHYVFMGIATNFALKCSEILQGIPEDVFVLVR